METQRLPQGGYPIKPAPVGMTRFVVGMSQRKYPKFFKNFH